MFPLALLLLNSLKPAAQIVQNPLAFPVEIRWDNFSRAWKDAGFAKTFLNSALLAGATIVLVCSTSSLTAFVIARRKVKAWKIVTFYLLGTTTAPIQLYLFPLYFGFAKLGLINNVLRCVPDLYGHVFALRGDAAPHLFPRSADGARGSGACRRRDEWQVFTRVILPIVSPGILTVALIIGLYSWNEFLMATTFLQKSDRLTAVVSFYLLSGQYSSDWGEIMAAALMIVLPIVIAVRLPAAPFHRGHGRRLGQGLTRKREPRGTTVQNPDDYLERVYAGVLGKLIGVYLGRPFENWTYQRIMKELGPIEYFVHERLNQPLVVTDDDVAGTFTFIRALEDYGIKPDLSAEEIGKAWLNYIVEGRSILWWGGMGNSTEHTAWLNLKRGVPAPASGSIATNGKTVAEQIGAQIFIDGWAMVAPRQPQLAARLAREAARVSHDGEAVHAAMLWAAMESEAFNSADIDRLLDVGLSVIPRDCLIARLIGDIRAWHESSADWHDVRAKIEELYGYRQISRQLPRRAQPRAHDHGRALRAGRFPEGADDHQYVGMGHRLQRRKCGLPSRHHERSRRA